MSMFRKFRTSSPDTQERDTGRRGSEAGPSTTSRDDIPRGLLAVPVRSMSESGQERLSYASSPAATWRDRRLSATGYTPVSSSALTRPHPRQRTNHDLEPDDPLGLIFIHGVPQSDADIIFVHGLGGSSLRTWSWERRPDVFWPAWIRHEEGLSHFRVFSYGYKANFKESETPVSILDFSRGLLTGMKTYGNGENDDIGQRPIVFVAHSMGGLVVKKALILGKNDDHYSMMLSKVHGIMFFSTPHKGSPHARTLNNLLSLMVGTSAKVYIKELESSSTSIESITEQFRTICSQWKLISLYESHPTKLVSGVKKLIVGKDSGVLGYPQEMSVPIDADHHSICKFDSRLNQNYLMAVNLLRQLTQDLRTRAYEESNRPSSSDDDPTLLRAILGIQGEIQDDFQKHLDRAAPESCRWLHQSESFRRWLDASDGPSTVLWLTGLPGSGKSTLAAKTIHHIQEGLRCQYHFFVAAQPAKRSTSYCLRAIAYQLALAYPRFAEKLLDLHRQTKFSAALQKFQVIWDTIYENIIFQMDFGSTLHWVLDGLDEADAPKSLLQHLKQMRPQNSVKVLLLSRPKRELTNLAGPYPKSVFVEPISAAHTMIDIRNYIRSVVTEVLPQDKALQWFVIQRIAARAEGSFLWTRLALESLWDNWHTKEDIDRALNRVPGDMQTLYVKMMENVKSQSPRLRELGLRVLTWAACGFRSLTVEELEAALKPDFDGFVDLAETAVQVCGQFVRVDQRTICLIHGTARQFLLDASSPDAPINHDHLAVVCLQYLCDKKWRQVLSRVPEIQSSTGTSGDRLEPLYDEFPFLKYAINFWAYHVSLAGPKAPNLLSTLWLFCSRYILLWIQAAALSGNLRIVPRAAQYLKKWLRRSRRMDEQRRLPEDDQGGMSANSAETAFLERWTIDLIRLVAKFGNNLAQSPSAIHRHIPPFCPPTSAVSSTYFEKTENPLITVNGLADDSWDDNLARLSVGHEEMASSIRCTGIYFLTLVSRNGTVIVWHIETCEEMRRICHGEWVTVMETNKTGSSVATAGRYTIAVWSISTGTRLYSIPKQSGARIMSLNFVQAGAALAVGYDDCSVIRYHLETSEGTTILPTQGLDVLGNCPRFMVLSPNHSKLAIGFRGKPVIVRDMKRGVQARSDSRTVIRLDDMDRSEEGGDVFNSPEIARWQPDGSILYILYQDTMILAWNVIDDTQIEFGDTEAREMVLNEDGTCLLTSSNRGSVSVWGLPKLNLIYRLQSNEFVRDLAFSPDSQRIYDVRGSGCNVWAPDALVRAEELDLEEKSSSLDETAVSDVISNAVFAEDQSQNGQVTALVCDSEDVFFCCGRDDGSVSIHEISTGARVRKVTSHSATLSVIAIDWSSSRCFIVSADDSGKVIAKRLRIKEGNKWAVFPLFDLRVEGAVSQLLFNLEETLLLISTDTTDHIWDLKERSQICRKRRQTEQRCKWINNPNRMDELVCLESNQQLVYKWNSLDRVQGGESHRPESRAPTPTLALSPGLSSPPLPQETVNTVVLTESGRYLIYDVIQGRRFQRSPGLRVDLVQIQGSGPSSTWDAKQATLLGMEDKVSHLLGSLGDRLLFLDHDNWVCISTIGQEMGPIKRLYSLPRDWVNDETIHLTLVNRKGTLLCPRNGEVGIVKWKGRF